MNNHQLDLNTIDVCRAVTEHLEDDLKIHFKGTNVNADVILRRLSELIGKCNAVMADVAKTIDKAREEGGDAKHYAIMVLMPMQDLIQPVIGYANTMVAVADAISKRN